MQAIRKARLGSPDRRSGLRFSDSRLAGGFFAEEDCFGRKGCGRGFERGWPGATEILPLEDDVGEEQREGDASPDYRFGHGFAQTFPSGYSRDHAHFQEDEGNGEAADHPLAVLLDFSPEDEHKSDAGGGHPQGRIGGCGKAEGARGAHSFFEVLDVKAERGGNEDARNVNTANDAMEPGETLAEPIRELHGTENERAGAGKAVGQQPPLERLNVGPFRIFGVD